MTSPRVWALLLVAVLATVADLAYLKTFEDAGYLAVTAAAAATGTAAIGLAARRRWSTGAALLAAAVVEAAYCAIAVVPLDQLPAAAVNGWADLLSSDLPAKATGSVLLVPTLLTAAAAIGGALAVTRTSSVLLPILPPFTNLATAVAASAGRPANGAVVPALFLLFGVALALVRAGAKPAVATALAALVSVLGTTAALALPGGSGMQRSDLRLLYPPRLLVTETVSPLVEVAAERDRQPATTLFAVRLQGNPGAVGRIDRFRVVALGAFDGVSWLDPGRYRAALGRLPAGSGRPNRGVATLVTEAVQVLAANAPFLPVVGWPTDVSGEGAGFDPASGTVAVPTGTRAGSTFGIAGAVVPVSEYDLRASGAVVSEGSSALPTPVPLPLVDLARRIVAGTTNAVDGLRSIERYLANLPPRPGPVASGESYAAIERFLTPSGAPGGPEQYAAAFAVLARIDGYPARIAVGYVPGPQDRTGAGSYHLTTADAFAWPEVHFARAGWVAFNPLPVAGPAVEVRPVRSVAAGQGVQAGTARPDAHRSGPTAGALVAPSRPFAAGHRPDRSAEIAAAGAITLGLMAALVIAGRRRVRRYRRRRARTSAEQVLNAWREVTDRMHRYGCRVDRSQTPAETATRCERRIGAAAAASATAMAPLVLAAAYRAEPPTSSEVAAAWSFERDFCTRARRDAPLRLNVRATLGFPVKRRQW